MRGEVRESGITVKKIVAVYPVCIEHQECRGYRDRNDDKSVENGIDGIGSVVFYR